MMIPKMTTDLIMQEAPVTVLCFGDSNTYGYDPRGYFGGRYEADSRWVDILAEKTGWTVCNMGQNGREIPTSAPPLPAGGCAGFSTFYPIPARGASGACGA